MAKLTRIVVNARAVADQFHRGEFDTSPEGIIAKCLHEGWQNMVDVIEVPMMKPHRKSYDLFLKTFIPNVVYLPKKAGEGSTEAALRHVAEEKFPTCPDAFYTQMCEIYAQYGVQADQYSVQYAQWCMYVYGAMIQRNVTPMSFRLWAGVQASQIVARTPHTLLHDVTAAGKPILSHIVPSYLKYGERYLAGLNLGSCNAAFIEHAGPTYGTARAIGLMLNFAFNYSGLNSCDELIAALLIDRHLMTTTHWSFDDVTHISIQCMLTGKFGAFEFNRMSREIVREIQALLLRGRVDDRLDESGRKKLPRDLAQACHVVMERYLQDHPRLTVADGKLCQG